MNKNKALFPWHINNTLSEKETLSVEFWLQSDSEADAYHDSVQQLASVIGTQELIKPSHQVRAKIVNSIQQPAQQRNGFSQWIWGVPLATLIFALLWLMIQPGNQLQWSVSGSNVAAFRVYRAPVGDTTFEFVEELPADPAQQSYQFADPLMIPGLNYNYAIETIDQFGNTSISQVAASNSMMVFAAQFAILLTSFFLAFGMITIAQELNYPPQSYLVQ